MHGAIWRFVGDPDDLLRRYDAMIAEIPWSNLQLHVCLRAADGIVLVDTCRTRESFEAFAAGPFPELRRRHGLPEPVAVEDLPVHLAVAQGDQVE